MLRVLRTPGRPRRAPTCGLPTPAPRPGQQRPSPGPSFPPSAPQRSANISCPCPHPHPELPSWRELGSQPGQGSRLPQLGFPGHRGWEGEGGGGCPAWLGSSHRGNPGARSCGRSLGRTSSPARRKTSRAPTTLLPSTSYLLACGGVLGRSASPGAVSPRSCPCWLFSRAPCTGGGGLICCSALLPRTAASRVNGSCCPASGAHQSPPGRALPRHRLRHKLCGRGERGRWPTPQHSPRWPGQGGPRRCPAEDQLRGRGGERGRAPRQLLPASSGLPTGAGPPQPVTHLPNPAPAQPRCLPPARGARAAAAARPRCACDRWHRPLGPGLVFSLVSPRVRTAPSAPPSQVPAPPPVSRGAGPGIIRPQWPPAACPAAAFPSLSHRPDSRPRPLGGTVPIPPGNCLAWSRQTRDPGSAPPLSLRQAIGSGRRVR